MKHSLRLWPATCRLCGCSSDLSGDACSTCIKRLPEPQHGCARCALVLPHTVDECGSCLRKPPAFDRAWAAFVYQPPVTSLIQRFKFNGDLAAGRLLAERLASRITGLGIADQPQLMIPVPLFRYRQWRRGFNQAELLCRDLSKQLPLDWLPAMQRIRATQTQSDLAAKKRAGNVAGAFAIKRMPDVQHAVLVDDVMTTGATLNECAKVLKAAGLKRVDVWVLARA